MRVRTLLLIAGALRATVADAGVPPPKKAGPTGRCQSVVVEGEVKAGESFRQSFATGLDVVMEPVAAGWVLRVLPTARAARLAEDLAELGSPPYRSVSPLLVSTDFGFRAQDAVGWNPRRFRYVADGRSAATLDGLYRKDAGLKVIPAEDERELGKLVAASPEGVLEIVDASLAPGTADQGRGAGLLATHFATTAHRIEQPARGKATALGRLGWMRFRVRLQLPPGLRAAAGAKVEPSPCGT